MYADTCKLERESEGRPTVQNIYSVYVYKFATRVLPGHSHVIRGHPPLVKVQDPSPSEYATMAAAIVKRYPFLAESLTGVQCYVRCFSILTII